MSITDIETRFKSLMSRHARLSNDKMRVDAEHEARRRALRASIDDCKKSGYDPDTLVDEIKRLEQVVAVKLDVFDAELTAAEELIKPMLRVIG